MLVRLRRSRPAASRNASLMAGAMRKVMVAVVAAGFPEISARFLLRLFGECTTAAGHLRAGRLPVGDAGKTCWLDLLTGTTAKEFRDRGTTVTGYRSSRLKTATKWKQIGVFVCFQVQFAQVEQRIR